MNIEHYEIDNFFNYYNKIASGLAVGNYEVLFRQLQKSGISGLAIDLLVGATAIYFGRALMEEMEYLFDKQVIIYMPNNQGNETLQLESWPIYQAVVENHKAIKSEWLQNMVSTFSSEWKEVHDRLTSAENGNWKPSIPVIKVRPKH